MVSPSFTSFRRCKQNRPVVADRVASATNASSDGTHSADAVQLSQPTSVDFSPPLLLPPTTHLSFNPPPALPCWVESRGSPAPFPSLPSAYSSHPFPPPGFITFFYIYFVLRPQGAEVYTTLPSPPHPHFYVTRHCVVPLLTTVHLVALCLGYWLAI